MPLPFSPLLNPNAAPPATRVASDLPPLISLQQVSRSFEGPGGQRFHAVQNVDLTVQAGEVLGIIGRSGAGKSTLLRMINLLERPDQGRVQVGGQTLTDLSTRALRRARSGIGMIFQQFNLLQNATVADNVALPCNCTGAGAVPRSTPGWRNAWPRWALWTRRTRIRPSSAAGRSSVWPLPARSRRVLR